MRVSETKTVSEAQTALTMEKEKLLWLIMGLAIFFVPSSVRSIIYAASVNKYFDIAYIAIGSFLFLVYALRRQLKPGVGILAFCLWSMAFLSNIIGGQNLFNQMVTFFNMSLPVLFLGLELKREVIGPVITTFLKVMNAVIIFSVLVGIADMVSGGVLTHYLIGHVYETSLASLASKTFADGVYRFNFIFGYSLTMAWLFLLFFALNVLNNQHNQVLIPTLWVSLITIAGLVVCNSRSALIIGVLMIIFMNGEHKRRGIYIAMVLMLLAGIAFVPFVRENVAQRFVNEMREESISGGRNEAALLVIEGWAEPPGIILGKGLGYSRKITSDLGGFINSFEYPVLMYAYDFSIASTAILYLVILVLPLTIFIQERQWLKAGLFLSITVYINGFNMLVDGADGLVQFCFAVMLLMHIGREDSTVEFPASSQLEAMDG